MSLWIAVWMAEALAAPAGFWHPDDLAPLSRRFMDSSEQMQGPFGERTTAADRLATALRQYREALDLLGARAPASERERLDGLERQFVRQHAVLQQFADQLVADYDAAFTAAVERAVAGAGASAGGEVVQCEATIASGPAIPGVPVRRSPNPACHGEDLNARLAAAVDADAALASEIDAMLARPWPEVGLPAEPVAPVGGAQRWLGVRDLVVAGAREALSAIERKDDEARGEIDAAIEQGATLEQLRALEPEAERIAAVTGAARAALAAPVLAAADKRLAKWSSEPATGWCANPALLGGCTGADASRDLVARLLEDKKVRKALSPR